MNRVIAYVDGFNLYFGLKSKKFQRYYWPNVQQLAQRLLRLDQELVRTKYFTSRVSAKPWNPQKSKRQNTYLEALSTLKDFAIFMGHYLAKTMTCPRCRFQWITHEEKMTDVNIAAEMLTDAYADRFDTALLISGDSDLTHPIEIIRDILPEKRIVVGFPPDRVSKHLKRKAHAYFTIHRKNLARSQFPDELVKSDGFVLHRPDSWR